MEDKTKVMSIRLDQATYRRLHAFGTSKNTTDSAAARELIASGLARDGLELYSTELGAYLRGVVQPLIESFDESLERRNEEQEDRIARCVHRATRGSIVAAIAACEIEKGLFDGLRDVPASEIYERYDKQAGLVQAGYSLEEARDRVRRGKE